MIKTILRNCNQHSLNCPSSTTVRGDTFQDVHGPRRETTVSSQSPPLTVVGKRLPSMEAQVETMEPEPESDALAGAATGWEGRIGGARGRRGRIGLLRFDPAEPAVRGVRVGLSRR